MKTTLEMAMCLTDLTPRIRRAFIATMLAGTALIGLTPGSGARA